MRQHCVRQPCAHLLNRLYDQAGPRTVYVLLNHGDDHVREQDIDVARKIADKFHTELGSDPNVSISAASPTKLVVHINGTPDVADKVIAALQSFHETAMVENRPRFRPLSNAGGDAPTSAA